MSELAPEPETQTEKTPRRRRVMLRALAAAALAVVVAGAAAVAISYRNEAIEDAAHHVTIALVAPGGDAEPFNRGVQLAEETINHEGGIRGRQVRLRVIAENDYSDKVTMQDIVRQTLRQASRVGLDDGILAVIGHGTSATAIPASAIYNFDRKLYIATHATATSLTNHNFDYVFALQPSNYTNAEIMARYALSQGLRRFIVLSDRSDYGVEVTKMFATFATQGGAEILYQGLINQEGRSIDRLLLFFLNNKVFKREDIDGIFLTSSSVEEMGEFISRARQLGLNMPILGAESLFSTVIENQVGRQVMRDVWAVSRFDVEDLAPPTQQFVAAYKERFKDDPDLLAAVGYDAMSLIAYVAELAGSLDPTVLADKLRVLRYELPFVGATGPIAFDANGLIVDTNVYVVRHDGYNFRAVAHYRQPLVAEDEARAKQGGAQTLAPSRNMGN